MAVPTWPRPHLWLEGRVGVERWFLLACRAGVAAIMGLLSLLADLTRGHPRVVAAKLGLGGVMLSLTGMVAACGDEEDTEAGTDDSYYWSCYTAPADTEAAVDQVSVSHDEDGWEYLVELYGWGEGVTLEIRADDAGWAWEEQHELEQGEYDPDGMWDRWELDLAVVGDETEQEAGLTTLLAADAATAATMSWRVSVYAHASLVDCVVWGADPGAFEGADCREIEPG